LALVAAAWLVVVVMGLVAALPYGLLGLLGLAAIGLLLVRALKDRLSNEEDDYYQKNVEK
jgi:xanthine/uracil/vitamin C permease (AzgA family)